MLWRGVRQPCRRVNGTLLQAIAEVENGNRVKAVGDDELQYLTLAEDPAGEGYGDAADQEVQSCYSVETAVLNVAGTRNLEILCSARIDDTFCRYVRYGKTEHHHRQRNNRLASHYLSPSQKRSIRQTSITLSLCKNRLVLTVGEHHHSAGHSRHTSLNTIHID